MKKCLGDLCGLDYDTAYFLKYGVNPPQVKKKCISTPAKFDWEKTNEPDPYYCWRGTRIPQWFE